MNLQILLNKNKSKTSVNKNNSLTTRLKSSKKLIPIDPISATISEINVYNSEREQCNNIRLTVEVNPICSNVLFNNITEIVKNEGTDDVKCLNYDTINGNIKAKDFENVMFKQNKNSYFLPSNNNNKISNAIRDTQLTNSHNNFTYHCGSDIFNNHLLRSKTFKTVCPIKGGNSDDFNTISDKMRTYDGIQIKGYNDEEGKQNNGNPNIDLHLYLNEEILTFKESMKKNLTEENGWFGFHNSGRLKVYNEDKNGKSYEWFNVINSRQSCDFINMYPNKELFYFEPIYNSYKRRIEKNWHYCITYPSSSTTDISFIDNIGGRTTLKAIYYDDTEKYLNGTDSIKIYSVSMHGLSKGDYVNLYITRDNNNKELVARNVEVIHVENEYIFYVYRNGITISEKWYHLKKKKSNAKSIAEFEDNIMTINGEEFTISTDKKKLIGGGGKIYYIINGEKANIDDKAQKLSYVKVANNNEVKYYVRIFSKLPNWKFSKIKVNEEFLEKNKEYKYDYQNIKNDFESHIGKLAFSKNIYNDNIGEIVFTDDICFDYLKDNLGRPLTELYLTIIKNNEGYREWYGKGDAKLNIKDSNIEYSHCFGKLNCGFKLSKESISSDEFNNVLIINNVDDKTKNKGLSIEKLKNNKRIDDVGNSIYKFLDEDEIQYNKYSLGGNEYSGDVDFYGDLCCYSNTLCDEQIIQQVDFRFNTAQREVTTKNYKSSEYFNIIDYDEIVSDDYDYGNRFKIEVNHFGNKSINGSASIRKEGYYYMPHYKISIKTFSSEISTLYPKFIKASIIKENGENKYDITTLTNHCLGENDILYIYNKTNNEVYNGIVHIDSENANPRKFELEIISEKHEPLNKKDFLIYKKTSSIPNYATLSEDGSCRYYWREILQNGFNPNTEDEVYPFTNNKLYINKRINLFLKRQNPECLGELRSLSYPFDIPTNTQYFKKENNYINEEDIEC